MSAIKIMQPATDPPSETPSALHTALEAIGFVGCIDDDENLSVDYKSRIDCSLEPEGAGKPASARQRPVGR
jgi:hypothetical protein